MENHSGNAGVMARCDSSRVSTQKVILLFSSASLEFIGVWELYAKCVNWLDLSYRPIGGSRIL